MAGNRLPYRVRAKARKTTNKPMGWLPAGFLFVSVLSFYCVLFPEASGTWGRNLTEALSWFAGVGRYALPLLVGYTAFQFLFHKDQPTIVFRSALAAFNLWSALVLVTLFSEAVWSLNAGGVVGALGKAFFMRLFGEVGAWIVALGLLATGVILRAGLSPKEASTRLWDVLVNDWQEWKKARATREPAAKEPRARKPPVVAPAADLNAAPKVSPKIMGGFPAELDAPKKSEKEKEKERAIPIIAPPKAAGASDKAPTVPKNDAATSASDAPAADSKPTLPYKSPELDIFEDVKRVAPVAKEELTERARLLEQTLSHFNIAAQVVEIHPGPVITRYDLQPAPGVKVASIASRADDLALAMRSIGIRVLAPIPGKGAVGVEIPNSQPEFVGLKELLARPEYFNHPSPLAFVLGKTVSGEPCIVDLAAMPHMLIAGSTGSGKSVVVHSLISSILYRMPPEMVKFTLIDPKRLELPGYSGIPHLYDPRNPCNQAEVITNPKQAAKALTRLVKVMEYRYDQFAKFNVRNIDSYNKKRKAEGQPPEYYLVVIIDELADLMLTAPKDVEDSIQRLAQMARAVGIHLVLATQRPSVDVITGVIKANLPARIALRVASSTDSRVIVDCIGAESLLGKGDMLYLPPASAEPMRAQGAFVSEKEVENLVAHARQFGSPKYDDLFSSGSALEFAVEDKKEMKDLIEALTLVLERKRVSQDLLKAHFGSSARATNILSLMEVKQFIQKPEGSNRWEINFDMIEEFVSKASRVPENESTLG